MRENSKNSTARRSTGTTHTICTVAKVLDTGHQSMQIANSISYIGNKKIAKPHTTATKFGREQTTKFASPRTILYCTVHKSLLCKRMNDPSVIFPIRCNFLLQLQDRKNIEIQLNRYCKNKLHCFEAIQNFTPIYIFTQLR